MHLYQPPTKNSPTTSTELSYDTVKQHLKKVIWKFEFVSSNRVPSTYVNLEPTEEAYEVTHKIMAKYSMVITRVVVDASFTIIQKIVVISGQEVVHLNEVHQMVYQRRTQTIQMDLSLPAQYVARYIIGQERLQIPTKIRETKTNLKMTTSYVMRCAIWYHFYNLRNVKNTLGGVLLAVKLLLHGCFSRFLNCTNGIKSRNASHIVQ